MEWISVKDRLPPNADCPGAFCPRYLVQTKYGITEGWYNPDKGYWYCLFWFMIDYAFNERNIDFEHGDIPKVLGNCPVTHWMPIPEPPKMEGSETRRGRWVSENPRTNSWTFICSACGGKAYYPRMGKRDGSKVRCGYEYCPHCGAIMEGVEE